MPTFETHDGFDVAATNAGSRHVRLGLKLAYLRTATFTLLVRPPARAVEQQVDVKRLRAAIVAGVASANANTATPVFVTGAFYASDDAPQYDLYRECAYLLALRRVLAVRPVVAVLDEPIAVPYGTPDHVHRRTSRLAVVSTILAVLAFPCLTGGIATALVRRFPGLAGTVTLPNSCGGVMIVATAVAVVSIVRISRSARRLHGMEWAIASLVISLIWWSSALFLYLIVRNLGSIKPGSHIVG